MSGRFVANSGHVVYATQRLAAPLRRARAIVSFVDGGGVAPDVTYGSAVVLLSKDSTIIQNCVHIVMTRTGFAVQKIVNQAILGVTGGNLNWVAGFLPKDGSKFALYFELQENGDWTATFAGKTISGNDPDLVTVSGPYITIELFSQTNVDSLGRFESIDASPRNSILDDVGVNLVPNGTFDSGANWTGWTIGSGLAQHYTASGSTPLTQTPALPAVVGETYLLTYELGDVLGGPVSGSMVATFGGVDDSSRSTQSIFSTTLTAVATGNLSFAPFSSLQAYLDNVWISKLG
ncbi:hypothetical protein [Mesorhizobium sp.]|uniref:hypothetical protein n=1 Tax=Mesorhizobium sp. TaxID=1871066 RepID=UPI001228B5BA|nr:hypothetical protein [Mesorhizobium sp.]TIN09788.1 MAG: hypothetical protein E5Y14_13605 [Mesorhizobium sp.]